MLIIPIYSNSFGFIVDISVDISILYNRYIYLWVYSSLGFIVDISILNGGS